MYHQGIFMFIFSFIVIALLFNYCRCFKGVKSLISCGFCKTTNAYTFVGNNQILVRNKRLKYDKY